MVNCVALGSDRTSWLALFISHEKFGAKKWQIRNKWLLMRTFSLRRNENSVMMEENDINS